MTDYEIKHFLSLKEKVNTSPVLFFTAAVAFVVNSYFQYYSIFDVPASLLIASILLYNSIQAYFKDSDNAKSFALIEKLVNKDPELVKQLNRIKNV